MVTWLPVMSAGAAADVLCAVSCLACPWATAVRDLPNRWAYPGQRLLNASTGRSLDIPDW